MAKVITVEQALSGNKDFYCKTWQQNGFYPIDKYVYHPETDEYEEFVQKLSGWRSWGIPKAGNISNKDWLKYIFEHNSHILTYGEMTNDKEYNNE
jgi:hypothetical protein